MFCGNCGAQNADNAAFCKNCGAQLNTAPQQPQQQPVYQQPQSPIYQQPYYMVPKKPINKALIGILSGGAVLITLAIILLIVLLGGGPGAGSPEAIAEKMVNVSTDFNTDTLLGVLHEDTLEYLVDRFGYDDIDEMYEAYDESADAMRAQLNSVSASMKFRGEAVDTNKVSKSELKEISERYEEMFDLEVTAAAEVAVETTLTVSYQGQSYDERDTVTFYAVEIDGTWYIDVFHFELRNFNIF